MPHETEDVSIRYSLSLEDGTPVAGGNLEGDLFRYTPGSEEIMPVLEAALHGLRKGDRREIVLPATPDAGLKLDVSRLAFSLGLALQTLVLRVEVL